MRVVALVVSIVLLAVVATVLFSVSKREAPTPLEPATESFQPSTQVREPVVSPIATPPSEGSEKLLERLNQVISKLEKLEISVREARTEITLRSDERSRTVVTAIPSNATSKLGESDLESLRTLIREELVNEAWKSRQEEIVGVGRYLASQLPLEAKSIDPMIEVLCTNGRTMFDLERELVEKNHDRGLAKRRATDFKFARRHLREDLGSVYRDDEPSARIFLHVVSHGEVASIHRDRDRLLATEKDWLR